MIPHSMQGPLNICQPLLGLAIALSCGLSYMSGRLFTTIPLVSKVTFMPDERSNRIAVVCHCMMNVHSLEANLAEYRGLEEEVIGAIIESGFGIVQLRCPETRLHGVERLPMPKDTYDKPTSGSSTRPRQGRRSSSSSSSWGTGRRYH